MARRKPLDQLSPAYRRRIENAEARGLTRRQARGHGGPASEYEQRRTAVRAKARASVDTYRNRFENLDELVDRLMDTYRLAGIVPILRQRQKAAQLYHDRAPGYDDAADELGRLHDKYRRRRPRTGGAYVDRYEEIDFSSDLIDAEYPALLYH